MDDNTKNTLIAVGVGVGATAAIATAMYFLGGREAPKMSSLGDVTGLAKREIGFGAVQSGEMIPFNNLPPKMQHWYSDSPNDVVSVQDQNGESIIVHWTYHDYPYGSTGEDIPKTDRWVYENGDWVKT